MDNISLNYDKINSIVNERANCILQGRLHEFINQMDKQQLFLNQQKRFTTNHQDQFEPFPFKIKDAFIVSTQSAINGMFDGVVKIKQDLLQSLSSEQRHDLQQIKNNAYIRSKYR